MSFYGAEQRFSPRRTAFPGIDSPQALYAALLSCWSAETCAPRMRERWLPDNPTHGQCSITSFLAQDLFGGEVRGVPLPDGGVHCFNVLDGQVFDLTSEQFHGRPLCYENCPPQRREDHFAMPGKFERYVLLCRRLAARCAPSANGPD